MLNADKETEFPSLKTVTYLDNAGSGLYSTSQLKSAFDDLNSNVYGNPHSASDSNIIRECRQRALRFLGVDETRYSVIFQSGTTAALRTVAETVLRVGNANFYYLDECHTSVVGMRNLARKSECFRREELERLDLGDEKCVVAFPAMSNFCGYKFPIESWIRKIRKRSHRYVLLDASAHVSTNPLNLESVGYPDFVCLSFYKIFGFPTGIGALIVKKESLNVLRMNKKYFGGGTVEMYCIREDVRYLKSGHDGLEDGTLPFHQIASSVVGFDVIDKLGINEISRHVFKLAQICYHRLMDLRYRNGHPLVVVYASTDYKDPETQGAIVNFNVLNPDGSHVGFAKFRRLASIYDVRVRVGCYCNTGSCQRYLGLTDEDLKRSHEAGHICGDDVDLLDGSLPLGSIRISFGYYNDLRDIDMIVRILTTHYLQPETIDESFSGLSTKELILKSMFLYPIKSCGAFSVSEWPVSGSSGLLYDRRWIILQGTTVLTQKIDSTLALIKPSIDLRSRVMTVTYPNLHRTLKVDLNDRNHEQDRIEVEVCKNRVYGYDEGHEASEWLEDCLGITGLKLIRIVSRSSDSGTQNSANQSQFLILNTASVKHILAAMTIQRDRILDWMMGQFRCNLVMESDYVNEENYWTELESESGLTLISEGPCSRCSILGVDQETGLKTQEPLMTLSKHKQFKFGVLASSKIRVDNDSIVLKVGDRFQRRKKTDTL